MIKACMFADSLPLFMLAGTMGVALIEATISRVKAAGIGKGVTESKKDADNQSTGQLNTLPFPRQMIRVCRRCKLVWSKLASWPLNKPSLKQSEKLKKRKQLDSWLNERSEKVSQMHIQFFPLN